MRTPIITGATDTPENIEAIGSFLLSQGLPEKWELCTFNNLCKDKYTRLGTEWAYATSPKIKKSDIESLTEIAKKYIPYACYTGATD